MKWSCPHVFSRFHLGVKSSQDAAWSLLHVYHDHDCLQWRFGVKSSFDATGSFRDVYNDHDCPKLSGQICSFATWGCKWAAHLHSPAAHLHPARAFLRRAFRDWRDFLPLHRLLGCGGAMPIEWRCAVRRLFWRRLRSLRLRGASRLSWWMDRLAPVGGRAGGASSSSMCIPTCR